MGSQRAGGEGGEQTLATRSLMMVGTAQEFGFVSSVGVCSPQAAAVCSALDAPEGR